MFLKHFPVIYFWWLFYFISVIYIYKRLQFWYSLWVSFDFFMIQCNHCCILKTFIIFFILDFLFFCCFLSSWETPYMIHHIQICFGTFVIQQLNSVENEIVPSHWCFWINLVSWKIWLEKLINKIIFIIVSHKFCIVTLQVHYTIVCTPPFLLGWGGGWTSYQIFKKKGRGEGLDRTSTLRGGLLEKRG